MVNKRRRRTIIVWVTIIFVLICQLPNLVFNNPYVRKTMFSNQSSHHPVVRSAEDSSSGSGGFSLPENVLTAHLVVPPGWIGYGVMSLKEGEVWPALGTMAGGCVLGVLGLMRAYRMTLRFYQGAEGGDKARPVVRDTAPAKGKGKLLVERDLPGLPEDTAALVLATLRSLLRAPELKMAAIMPIVMGIVMSSAFFSHPHQQMPAWGGSFVTTGAVVFAVFSMAQMMGNTFGLDRNGFRGLILLPIRRHHVLLAKNLAFFPIAALVALVLFIPLKLLLNPPWEGLATAVVQLPTAFLLFCLLCNFTSVLAPYRMAQGSLKARKPKAVVMLAMFATTFLTPVVMLPVLVPAALGCLFTVQGWVPWLPVSLLTAVVVLAAVVFLYAALLPLQGRLLLRREQAILLEVTEDTE
jgi:hypothetical protein